MKLNLTENLGTLENLVSRHLLQSIEGSLPENPRYVADRVAAERARPAAELSEIEAFLAHPEDRDIAPAVQPPITLRKGFTWGNPGELSHPVVIECVSGSIWLTLGHGQRDDIVLPAGQSYISQPGDSPVVEALENSAFRIR